MPHLIAPRFVGPAQGGPYQIASSCILDSADSDELHKSIGSTSNRRTATYSVWTKRGKFGALYPLFNADYTNDAPGFRITFDASDQLEIYHGDGGTIEYGVFHTTAVYRDPSAWYHIVVAVDTTQSTSTDRIKLYVNGAQIPDSDLVLSSGSKYPSQNFQEDFNRSGATHVVGGYYNTGSFSNGYDGYLAQAGWIDGTALDPTSFGEFDENGVWRPIDVTGLSFGTNGFLLDFADSGDLGNDVSGNGNDYTPTVNISSANQTTDTPTMNYATWSPIANKGSATLSDGNRRLVGTGVDDTWATIPISAGGKLAVQLDAVAVGGGLNIGIEPNSNGIGSLGSDVYYYADSSGNLNTGTGTDQTGGASYTDGDKILLTYDADAGEAKWYKLVTGAWALQYTKTGLSGNDWMVYVRQNNATADIVAVENDMAASLPTGFSALNTANLLQPTIKDGSAQFQPTLYTGNGTARSIDQSGNATFQPDLVWIKNRDQTDNHMLVDSQRGATKVVHSNTTDAEATDANGVTSFDSDGFGLGTGANGYNDSGEDFVAWQWKANGSGVSNTDGTITSTVSANTAAGFSIVKYTGTGATGATIGHGLGAVPKFILVKSTSTSVSGWITYHANLGATEYLLMNTTGAAVTTAQPWNNTAPTSSVFTVYNGTGSGWTNDSGVEYIAYCFAEIEGYSKFGSYTGNGNADGPFVYTGFKPAFIMTKRTDGNAAWFMLDAARDSYNEGSRDLYANQTNAEDTANKFDFLSNGFKPRSATNGINTSDANIVYIAFAEHPFGGKKTTPATAR